MSINEVINVIGNDTTPVEIVTTPARLFILVAQLQLALRHPGNTGTSAEIARELAENMTEVICHFHPEAREWIEQDWNPAYDITQEEFDSEWLMD